MLANPALSPTTCKPDDVLLAFKKNRMQYFYTDVQFRGEYPVYTLRYFKESNICFEISEEDKKLLKENTMDYLAISYYYSSVCDVESNTMKAFDANQNPHLEKTIWDWRANPKALYYSIGELYDRYQKPIIIAIIFWH